MNIGETIRKYRKDRNLTQEEMANRLGVTAPAVNKWENGVSYPDITLLAPIARLLDISPDILLSFQKELTGEEIETVVKEVERACKNRSCEEVFQMIRGYLQEYPNQDALTWQLCVMLDGNRLFRSEEDGEDYDAFLVECYERVLKSREEHLRAAAAESLYNLYVRKEQYEKAEDCLQYFSAQNPERKRKQALLYSKTGRVREAYQKYEELLFSSYQSISMILNGLFLLAVGEQNRELAHSIVEKQAGLAALFEMGEYYEVSCRLELATEEKDEPRLLETAQRMLETIETIGSFRNSPLYSHINFKNMDPDWLAEMKKGLLNCFRDENIYGFMRKNQNWNNLLSRYER